MSAEGVRIEALRGWGLGGAWPSAPHVTRGLGERCDPQHERNTLVAFKSYILSTYRW